MDRYLLAKVVTEQQQEFLDTPLGIGRLVELKTHLKSPTVVSVITGVRRCGKSTLLRQILAAAQDDAQAFYLRLDDPRLATFSASDFDTAYQAWLKSFYDPKKFTFALIDEPQNVTGWERWVDYFSKRAATKVFVTGSNSQLLSSEFATFLTGRQLPLSLTPLSFAEIASSIYPEELMHQSYSSSPEKRAQFMALAECFYKYGGFPRVFLDQNKSLLPALYDNIVRYDIIARARRVNSRILQELALLLAGETTRLFNRSKVAKLIGVKNPLTVGKYLSLFTDAFLFCELRNFSPSLRKQLRSLSKFYAVDHALAREMCAGLTISSGAELEICVLNELLRRGNRVFYWLSQGGYELDFLLLQGRTPIAAVQVSESIESPKTLERELRGLRAAAAELKVKDLTIITKEEDGQIVEGGDTITVKPFWCWALELKKTEKRTGTFQ